MGKMGLYARNPTRSWQLPNTTPLMKPNSPINNHNIGIITNPKYPNKVSVPSPQSLHCLHCLALPCPCIAFVLYHLLSLTHSQHPFHSLKHASIAVKTKTGKYSQLNSAATGTATRNANGLCPPSLWLLCFHVLVTQGPSTSSTPSSSSTSSTSSSKHGWRDWNCRKAWGDH